MELIRNIKKKEIDRTMEKDTSKNKKPLNPNKYNNAKAWNIVHKDRKIIENNI